MYYIGFFDAQRSGYGDHIQRTMVFVGFESIQQLKNYVTYAFLNTVRREYPYERYSDLVLERIEEYQGDSEIREVELYHANEPWTRTGSFVTNRIGTVFNFGRRNHFISWDRRYYEHLDKTYHIIEVFSDKNQLRGMKQMLIPNGANPLTYLERLCVTMGLDPSKPIKTVISNVKDEELFDSITETIGVMPQDHVPLVVFHDTPVSRIYAAMMLVKGHFDLPGKAFYEFEHPFKRSLGNLMLEINIEPGRCTFNQLAISGYIFELETPVGQGTDVS